MLGVSLLTAVFGMYWDISLHIDNGRDPGPLANPAHYFILVGLFGVFVAGVLAIALPQERPDARPGRASPNGWWAPLGGADDRVCGAVSLLAFPLDDIWHRIFGQDVTLWGPTHLLLIGGAAFSILGPGSSRRGRPRAGRRRDVRRSPRFHARDASLLAGGCWSALSTFQAEFDFGVPQFRLVWQPAAARAGRRHRPGGGARLRSAGRRARGGAVLHRLRGLLALLVGPLFGQTTPHFPLYIVEALVVEPSRCAGARERPITLGALAGV